MNKKKRKKQEEIIMNRKIKKTVALLMSLIMIFFAFNAMPVSTANAEEISEQQESAAGNATATDAELTEVNEMSTEAGTEAVEETCESTEDATVNVIEQMEEIVEEIMVYATVDTNYTFIFTDGGSLNAVCENEHLPVVAHTSGGNQLHCIDASLSSAFQWTNYGWQSGGLTWSYAEVGNSSMADVLFEYYKGDNPNRAVTDGEKSGGTGSLYNQLTHDLDGAEGGTRTAPTKAAYKIVNASNADINGQTINATVDTANNIQKTETLTFLTGTTYLHHYVTVPAGVTMHYTPYDTGVPATATNTTVAVVNNTKAYFTAPLTTNISVSISSTCVNRDFNKGYYIGNMYILAPQKQLGSAVTLQRFMYCDGSPASASFSINFAALGSLKIQKISANPDITDGNDCYSLEGAEFLVPNADKSKSWTLTTKADGTAQLDNIPVGSYTIKETKASKGYTINPAGFNGTVTTTHTPQAPYIVEVGETPKNDPIEMLVQKKSLDGDYEGKYLEDAEFTVKFYKGVQQGTNPALDGMTADRIWVLKTVLNPKNNDVCALLDELSKISGDDFYRTRSGKPTLPLGTITIQETKAPDGYLVDDEVYVRTITDDGGALEAVDTYNMPLIIEEPNKRPVQFIKLGEDHDGNANPLANAGFKVCRTEDLQKDADGNYIWDESKAVSFAKDKGTELFTDQLGNAESCPLFYGDYMMRETTVPDNHAAVPDFFFTVDDDSTEPVVLGSFTDRQIYSYLKLIKADSETGKNITASHAVFKVWDYAGGEYVSFDGVSEFETDDDGVLFLPGRLAAGRYRLEEIKCPDGYYAASADTDITITNAKGALYEAYVDENGNATDDILTTAAIYNEQLKGIITIDKTAEKRSWDEEKGDFVSSDIKLSDVEFGIYAAEDIYSPDGNGTLLYSEGDKACTVITDENGSAESTELPLGRYQVVEEKTPAGYKPSEPQTVKIAFDDKAVEITEAERTKKLIYKNVDVYNYAKIPKIRTAAKDVNTNSPVGSCSESAQIEDTVSYDDLIPGREYELFGKVMLQSTGLPLCDMNGNEVRSSLKFTPESESGEVKLKYTFDSRLLAGQTVVVFEDLYCDGEKAAVHADIEDEKQSIYFPKIRTLAVSENGTKAHIAYGMLHITDTCSYENVVPGYWYRVNGILMNRATKAPLLDDDGCIVTAETYFYADKSSGTVDVSYDVDVTWMPGYYIVVFEELHFAETGAKIAEHADIEDENQTIKIKERGWLVLHGAQSPSGRAWHSKNYSPGTGDSVNTKAAAVVGMLALILGAAMLLVKRKKNRKKEPEVIVVGQKGTGKRLFVLSLFAGLSFGLCGNTAHAEEMQEDEYVVTKTETCDTGDESKYDFGFDDEIITADGISYKLDHIDYDKTSVYESVYGEEGVQTEITKEKEKIKNVDKESFKPEETFSENDMEYVFKDVKFEQSGYADENAVKTLDTDVLQALNVNEYPKSLEYEYDGEKYDLPYSKYEEKTGWYSGFKLTGTIYGYDGGSFNIGDNALTDEQLNDTDILKIFMRENGYGADIYRPTSFEYASEPYVSVSGKVCRDYIINYDLYGTVYTLIYEKKLDAPLYKAVMTYELSDDSTKKLEEMKESYIVTANAYYVETEGEKGLTAVQKAVLGAGIVFLIILFIALVIYLLKGGRKPTDYKSERDIRRDYKELK
ncbi:MAG: VaFE repeat-containing surface-anchored protein [Clostridium sp.]|nr:VaFE repeat-containing surface-anchored protein [Clostridium sp.]MCM1207789.1 VaFE repeat-containing surface-anchored protein [Ruminococcus sp.]